MKIIDKNNKIKNKILDEISKLSVINQNVTLILSQKRFFDRLSNDSPSLLCARMNRGKVGRIMLG